MGGNVLLISNNRCTTPDPVFPLGLAYLNSALRRAGHRTLWADSLAGGESLEAVLARYQPDVVGISVRNIDDVIILKRETFFDNLSWLGQTLRRKIKCPMVVGGSGFSIFPRQLLELSGADYGICGEGETGFVALLAALNRLQQKTLALRPSRAQKGGDRSFQVGHQGAAHGHEGVRPGKVQELFAAGLGGTLVGFHSLSVTACAR